MNAHTLSARLPRTWAALFGRHGSFTDIQRQAIPLLLDGHNTLLHAGTASGKTEAVLAPLIERCLPPDRPTPRLTLLYLLPTRALINDMAARLAVPLSVLRVRAAIKTHDFNTFDPRHPADLLLTTPESLDSLLVSQAKTLIHIRAIAIDELHAFDGTVRGDHLRVLLNRLRALRTFAAAHGDTADDHIQYAALSATLAQPETSAARYFQGARIVQAAGQRPIQAEYIALEQDDSAALLDYLSRFRQRGWKKALAFCNTRAEVESYAAQVRAGRSPFGDAIYVHYSNLDRERRHEIERLFAQAEAAICFASSTLELGIDIGSIDVVLMIGAPGSAESLIQRVGRASRREKVARAACCYRTPLERLLFEAMLHLHQSARADDHTDAYAVSAPFRPSAAVQQIFSLLRQSPTGGIRLNPTAALFGGLLSSADLESILGELQASGYLRPGRPGEWRAGERLNRLVDLQASEHAPLSLYSNIQNRPDTIKIRDHLSQRVIAQVDRSMLEHDTVLLEGRARAVQWADGDALWVSGARSEDETSRLHYRAVRPVMAYEVARSLPLVLGLTAADAPYLPTEDGWLWFHWLGDLYGRALIDLLAYTLSADLTNQPALCVQLGEPPRALPTWTPRDVTDVLLDHHRRYEGMLALGAYQGLLPLELRRRIVVEQFNIPRFLHAVAALRVMRAPDTLTEALYPLVAR